MAMNDDLAALVARHPGRIHGLASVDAYDGDRAAREAERAIRELGLRGLFVDCARGDLLIDAPQARPTLEVAARLGVPVFVHPVAPQPLTQADGSLWADRDAVRARYGEFSCPDRPGRRRGVLAIARLARCCDGACDWRTGDGWRALSSQSRLPSGTIDVMRKHVFIDTTLFHPALIRASVDLLGA